MRTSIATVCLSGTLEEKMWAAASAGFDGIEVFEQDLDPVEACRGGGVQLLLEGSREADGGDGRPHQLALRGRARPGGRAGGVTAGLIGPPVGWATRRTCRASHIVEITSVV